MNGSPFQPLYSQRAKNLRRLAPGAADFNAFTLTFPPPEVTLQCTPNARQVPAEMEMWPWGHWASC